MTENECTTSLGYL